MQTFLLVPKALMGFPGGSAIKNLPAMEEKLQTQFQSLGWEDPLEEGMATQYSILAWEIRGQRSLVGYSPWGCKETDRTKLLSMHARKAFIVTVY